MFIITVSSFVSNNFRGRMWCNLHEVAACSFGIKHSRYCTGPIIRWPPKFDEHPWFIIKDDQSWICKPHFHIIIHDNILSFWIGRSHICSTSTKPPRCGLYQMQTVANWLKEDAEHAALRVCVWVGVSQAQVNKVLHKLNMWHIWQHMFNWQHIWHTRSGSCILWGSCESHWSWEHLGSGNWR